MSVSIANLEDLGEIKIYKRRGQKNIRLRVDNDGSIKLSLPWYVSKRAGLLFVRSKKSWIKVQREPHANVLSEISAVGIYTIDIKEHNLKRAFVSLENEIIYITLPSSLTEEKKRQKATKLIEEILRKKTQAVLVEKVNTMAKKNNIKIKSVSVKKLKSRWGSCDSDKNITLNLYLSQLPEEIWSYVLCHELAHTKHMNHSRLFWQFVKELDHDYLRKKKELAKFSPGRLNVR